MKESINKMFPFFRYVSVCLLFSFIRPISTSIDEKAPSIVSLVEGRLDVFAPGKYTKKLYQKTFENKLWKGEQKEIGGTFAYGVGSHHYLNQKLHVFFLSTDTNIYQCNFIAGVFNPNSWKLEWMLERLEELRDCEKKRFLKIKKSEIVKKKGGK